MVEDLGVKRYSVRETSGVWRQQLTRQLSYVGMRKQTLRCYVLKHTWRQRNIASFFPLQITNTVTVLIMVALSYIIH